MTPVALDDLPDTLAAPPATKPVPPEDIPAHYLGTSNLRPVPPEDLPSAPSIAPGLSIQSAVPKAPGSPERQENTDVGTAAPAFPLSAQSASSASPQPQANFAPPTNGGVVPLTPATPLDTAHANYANLRERFQLNYTPDEQRMIQANEARIAADPNNPAVYDSARVALENIHAQHGENINGDPDAKKSVYRANEQGGIKGALNAGVESVVQGATGSIRMLAKEFGGNFDDYDEMVGRMQAAHPVVSTIAGAAGSMADPAQRALYSAVGGAVNPVAAGAAQAVGAPAIAGRLAGAGVTNAIATQANQNAEQAVSGQPLTMRTTGQQLADVGVGAGLHGIFEGLHAGLNKLQEHLTQGAPNALRQPISEKTDVRQAPPDSGAVAEGNAPGSEPAGPRGQETPITQEAAAGQGAAPEVRKPVPVADLPEHLQEPTKTGSTEAEPVAAKPIKPPWEMSQEELGNAIKDDKATDSQLIDNIFGPDDGKKYRGLLKRENQTFDLKAADAASAQRQAMEDKLSPVQQDRLYGAGQPALTHEDLQPFLDIRSHIENSENEGELGRALAKHLITLGGTEEANPHKMTIPQQRAYAAMSAGNELIQKNGWDSGNVGEIAIRSAAAKFPDPEDAQYMLQRFLKPSTVAPELVGANENHGPGAAGDLLGKGKSYQAIKDNYKAAHARYLDDTLKGKDRVAADKYFEKTLKDLNAADEERFGPGAAGKGSKGSSDPSFREQTSIATLADRIKSQSSSDTLLPQRMNIGSRIADKLGGYRDDVSSALGKLRGGTAALYDAYQRPPSDAPYEKLTGLWSGADQRSALDIEQFKKNALARVPDKADRGAIGVYMEAGGDKAKLGEQAKELRANPKTAKYAPVYERAANLSEAHQNIARDTDLHNQATLEEAQKAGLLKDGLDNYLMHVWKNNPDMQRKLAAESNFNSLITSPGFTKQRTIPDYFTGIKKGMVPQDLDFVSLTAAHERSFREALAARSYIKGLNTNKASDGRPLVTVSAASAKELPTGDKPDPAFLVKPNLKPADNFADYHVVDHPSLRGWKWAASVDGKPVFVQGDMLVHPEIYNKLKNNLTRSGIQTWETKTPFGTIHPGAAALRIGSEAKSAILSLSGFHQTTLGLHALEHRTKPFGMPELDPNDPVQGKLIDHGLMVAHYNAADQFGDGVQSGGLITKIPGIGPAYHAYTDYLFKSYVPRLKMAMAKNALERNTERYGGKMSEDQILSMTADQANAAFGGLNYRMLGRNKTMQDVLRLTLMAPDFLEARARFGGQALKPGGREQLAALGLGAAAAYTGARVLNSLLDDKHDPHWDKPFSLVHGGKEYSLRTVQGDMYDAATDSAKFIKNRLSPLVNTGVQSVYGVDRFGNKATPMERAKNAAKELIPIPAQPWANKPNDSTSSKVADTILKMIGVNSKTETTPDSPDAAAFKEEKKALRAQRAAAKK